MMNRVTLGGLELDNPFILESGPFAYDGQSIINADEAGFGAVSTETISLTPGHSPRWHLFPAGNSLYNRSRWSDISLEQWLSIEIPKSDHVRCRRIISLGHTVEDIRVLAPLFNRTSVDALKLVTYNEGQIGPMIREARKHFDRPILAKISPNWSDPVQEAKEAERNGADVLVAIDSLGPLRIPSPYIPESPVYGWLSGEALLGLSLKWVSRIRQSVKLPIVGTGGISDIHSIREMKKAGTDAYGVCTSVILNGLSWLKNLPEEDYSSMQKPSIPTDPGSLKLTIDPMKCTGCGQCVQLCGYRALFTSPIQEPPVFLEEKCRGCGMCIIICPREAITEDRIESISQKALRPV